MEQSHAIPLNSERVSIDTMRSRPGTTSHDKYHAGTSTDVVSATLLINQALGAITHAGLRVTTPRKLLIEELLREPSPRTHADLSECLRQKGVDAATVFRNLKTFCELGFIRRAELGDHVWRFEWNFDSLPHSHDHSHFVCESCGSVTCLPGLTQQSSNWSGSLKGIGVVTELLLKGYCEPCLTSSDASRQRAELAKS